jgi:uncharacterized protein YciI
MFILIVSYTQPAAKVEPHIAAHGIWVKRHFDSGVFLFAGPKKSGLGGVIAARAIEKAELLRHIAEDPYVIEDVADYQIVECDFKLAQTGLEALKAC